MPTIPYNKKMQWTRKLATDLSVMHQEIVSIYESK